ncbi:hypothetical protein E2G42_24165 [Salmonella enterica subsp. enterica]|nr:hypothetical protein [Salmonella enterica subsp. enterica]
MCNKGCGNNKDSELLLKGDIMRHVKNIFLVLAFALSAAAFSTSAMAASDSKPPPDNTKHSSSGLPEIPWALIGMSQEWCNQYPPDIQKPPDWCQICRC